MVRVIWSEKALSDLEEILRFLEQQSPTVARRYGSAILARVEQLERFPLSGGVIEEEPNGPYRQVLQGPYRIIYRAEPDRVLIVATHHASRLLDPQTLG